MSSQYQVADRTSSAVRSPRVASAFFMTLVCGAALFLGTAVSSGRVMSDEKNSDAEKNSVASKKSADEKPTDDEVLSFARQHHPELAGLLEQLKLSRPKEFSRAIKELAAQVTRLDRTRERMPARFEYELSIWKIESQTKLLVARWAMSQDPDLEKQIKDLMRTRSDLKLAQLKADRDKMAERLKSLEEQIAGDEGRREEMIDEEFKRLSRQAGNARKSSSSGAGSKSASKTESKTESKTDAKSEAKSDSGKND